MMPFKVVILWTDALLFLLIAAVVTFCIVVRARPHLSQPWRYVAHSKQGMAALVFLGFFLVVGVLDSLHFRPRLVVTDATQRATFAVQTLSVLDVVAAPLRTRTEKTYSAPLATHLFAKETVDLPDGGQARLFPRLVYGGAHLTDPHTDWSTDVLRTAAAGSGDKGARRGYRILSTSRLAEARN